MECVTHRTNLRDIELCWFEWGTKRDGEETILLVHATGFHARCWDKTVSHLGDRHVIAVDLRGHGRSEKKEPYNWTSFGEDLIELLGSLDLTRVVGVGHSMGGHAVTVAASHHRSRFERLVLIDPVILDPESYELRAAGHVAWLDENGVHPVAKRKNFFQDAQAMYDNFHGRGSYATWRDDVLHDYCEFGLLQNPEGEGYVLACPPTVEASIYMGSSGTDIYDRIQRVEVPTTILRARERDKDKLEMDFSASPTWSGLADIFPRGRDVYLPDMTHFIPMEDPGLAAAYIRDEK